MSSLSALNLKYNPFRDVSAVPAGEGALVWASMVDVKAKIQKCYKDCITNNSKQIVLNWGPYGGGKTFSAYYFSYDERDADNLTHIYIHCPKDGTKATDEFFKSIIDNLTFDGLREQIKQLIEENGEDELIRFLTPRATREFAKAIVLIGSEDEEISGLMNRLLYGGVTKTELKKLGLAKDIQTDADSVKFLAGILSCYTGNNNIFNGRVVIWIDEMEDLIYYSPKHYKAFSQILRDLFDSLPDRLLVFLNFTLAEGQENTIELVLGGALWSRITRKIRYTEFTQENAIEYCKELLNPAKQNKSVSKPFPDTIITEVINSIPLSNLTPREINKHMTSIINYALENDLSSLSQGSINKWAEEFSEDNI